MKKILTNLLVVIITSLIGFIVLEVGIRSMGRWDEDGQFYFNDQPIIPYQIPISKLKDATDDIDLEDTTKYRVIYDENLGWTNNPDFVHSGGIDALYVVNDKGLRATHEYNPDPLDDTLRIALFGDSFTFGGEVANDATWSHHLEIVLAENGIKAEVLNFGISGYGMDQAYLRWQQDGIAFKPDIVMFGFSPFDIRRNTNLFRSLADFESLVAKPRFILEDDDELRLVHQPVTPPQDVINVLTNFYQHPLSQYEGYYDSRFSQQWWLESKVIALIVNSINPPPQERGLGTVTPDELTLSERITLKFGEDVTAEGSEFVVVHLPGRVHLEYFLSRGTLGYLSTLDNINKIFPVWHFESVLTESKSSYWRPQTHYSNEMNLLLANFTAGQLITCLTDETCLPQRFTSIGEFSISE